MASAHKRGSVNQGCSQWLQHLALRNQHLAPKGLVRGRKMGKKDSGEI
jgi:hypothetical protein